MPSIGMNGANVIVVASCTALATVWTFMRRVLESYKRLSIIAYPSLTASRSGLAAALATVMNTVG
jgi:hypothetical protein